MSQTTIKASEKYCVYQHGWDEGYRDSGLGDGITSPTRRCVAITQTREEAEAIMARVDARMERISLVPGSGRRRAMLAVAEYDPLDFVGSQNREDYVGGRRYAELCGRNRDVAAKTYADLMA